MTIMAKTKALRAAMLLVAVALLSTVPALAADVDGKWSGTIAGPQGDINMGFTFKADGAALTGSMTGMDGSEIAIKDGKVDGSNISFVVALDFGGMPFTLSFKGVVSGASIKLNGDAMGMPFELTLKKAAVIALAHCVKIECLTTNMGD